jgi:hypothetical protein
MSSVAMTSFPELIIREKISSDLTAASDSADTLLSATSSRVSQCDQCQCGQCSECVQCNCGYIRPAFDEGEAFYKQ